jgi:hypothetical protein
MGRHEPLIVGSVSSMCGVGGHRLIAGEPEFAVYDSLIKQNHSGETSFLL